MKKTKKIAILSLSALTLSVAAPVLANTNTGEGVDSYYRKAEDKKKAAEAARIAQALKAVKDAEAKALATYNKVADAYQTIGARFAAANEELLAAKTEQDLEVANARLEFAKVVADYEKYQEAAAAEALALQAAHEAAKTNLPGYQAAAQAAAAEHAAAAEALAAKEANPSDTDAYHDEVVRLKQDLLRTERAVAKANADLAKAEADSSQDTRKAIVEAQRVATEIYVRYENRDADLTKVVEAAKARVAKAEAAAQAVAQELSTIASDLANAKTALDNAIKASEAEHKKHGQAYSAPVVNEVKNANLEKQAADVQADKKAADNKAADNKAADKKAPAKQVAAAKTEKGAKALPKTSAAK